MALFYLPKRQHTTRYQDCAASCFVTHQLLTSPSQQTLLRYPYHRREPKPYQYYWRPTSINSTYYRHDYNIRHANSPNSFFFVSSCSCLCPIYRSHALSREWRCSRSSADRLHLSGQQLYSLLRCDLYKMCDRGSALAADSPMEIWWTVSRNYTVLFLSRDVKSIKYIYRKPLMFWRWLHHGTALWRHDRGGWHNCMLLTTASNVNYWDDIANHVTRLWHGLKLHNHGINLLLWPILWSNINYD